MQSRWSTRFAFIMAATGAAVGLGNIWKFPYMAGENGGGAFVLLYLLFVVLVGVPTLIGEILIGRLGRENAVNTLAKLALKAKKTAYWQWLGWWGALGLVFVLSFYSVVAGWSIGYLIKIWTTGFKGFDSAFAVQTFWEDFLADPFNLLLWHTLFMLLTLGVVACGVRKGLERATKILMPGLFLVLFILMIYSLTIGNVKSAFSFLLSFKFTAIKASTALYALGHAFFTLALGAGAMLIYGAYLPKETRIGSSVCIVAGLDILVALFAGLSIFSIVFAYDLPPAGGPGLMFKVLPIAFAKMPAGQWFGGLFFLLLWFAAWASSISMAEPLVVLLSERSRFNRKEASFIVGFVCWILGILALMSFNVWKDLQILGRFNLFDAMADLTTNIILPIGGLGFAVFAGWVLKETETEQALHLKNKMLFKVWQFLIRFIAPFGILVSFIWNFFK